jgi:hypothetical protein
MYSFVNVATLVRDLARSPRAVPVATELLRALALEPGHLATLDDVRYDAPVQTARRDLLLAADALRPRALQVLAAARGYADLVGMDAYSAALDSLESAPLGDLADLRAFVRREVLAACWIDGDELSVALWPRAVDVVSDGVVAAYTGDPVLGGPWRAWLRGSAVEPAPTPWPDVVDAVRRLPADADVAPAPTEWPARMHDACWAVHLTGRERVATVTQLHALRALCAVFAPAVPPLRMVAMTTAAVHAAVVGDVLDAGTHAAMSQPLFRLLT